MWHSSKSIGFQVQRAKTVKKTNGAKVFRGVKIFKSYGCMSVGLRVGLWPTAVSNVLTLPVVCDTFFPISLVSVVSHTANNVRNSHWSLPLPCHLLFIYLQPRGFWFDNFRDQIAGFGTRGVSQAPS